MKPDARIYQIALEKLGVAASKSVFLDDFPENVEGARAVGMQAIHFTQPEQALEDRLETTARQPSLTLAQELSPTIIDPFHRNLSPALLLAFQRRAVFMSMDGVATSVAYFLEINGRSRVYANNS